MAEPPSGHRTLREVIARRIREDIASGVLVPGAHVTEQELSDRLGISRTPIREAFRQLESEGFLTTVPHKGAVVAALTVRDVREYYEIKSLIEGYAAARAAARIEPRDLVRMERSNERLLAAHRTGDLEEMVQSHNEFHEIFVRAAGNERLAQLHQTLVERFQRFRILLSLSEVMAEFVDQHRWIIEALRARDAARAEELVRLNARHGEEELVRRLAGRSGGGEDRAGATAGRAPPAPASDGTAGAT